jgi:hypothetical protein
MLLSIGDTIKLDKEFVLSLRPIHPSRERETYCKWDVGDVGKIIRIGDGGIVFELNGYTMGLSIETALRMVVQTCK